MGALSSVDGEVARLARAMETFADATEPVRRVVRDVPAEDTAPDPQSAAVAIALQRLDARLAQLAAQSADSAAVLRDALADSVDEARAETRRAEPGRDGTP